MFDFCEHDLAGLLSNVLVKFTLSEIKRVMQMLLNGLYYIHRNKVGKERPRLGLASTPTAGGARLERSHVGKRHGQEAASWGSVGTPGGRFCHSLCGHRSFDFEFRRKI